jgi:8-oxo-dGTP pyrophosphatase MutT (NUDIX family)
MGGMPSRSHFDRAAAVCYRRKGESIQLMLVQTRSGQWTFPKGRIEAGESPWEAARREALEEAGVRGIVDSELLTVYPYEKRAADGRSVRQAVAAYLLQVETDDDIAEPGRNPAWFGPDEAKSRLGLGRNHPHKGLLAGVVEQAMEKITSDKVISADE